jgi:hypothetical protein
VSVYTRPSDRVAFQLVVWPAIRGSLANTLAVAWILVVLFLALYNLDVFPTTWFDEGSHLHVPKTLVQQGAYADVSSEGLRYFGPTAGVGPTVMLPIAAAFYLAGVGLLPARLVMVAYLLGAIGLVTLAARRQYCRTTAWLASVLIVTVPAVGLIPLGRQVLGEVPALAFLMLGFVLWRDGVHRLRPDVGRLVWASVAFGLVAMTKNQFSLVLLPTLVLLCVVDRLHHRQLRLKDTLFPIIGVLAGTGAWYAVQFLPLLGTGDAGRMLALWREASAGAVFVFSPARAASSLHFLAGPDVFAFWGAAGIVYGLMLARQRSLVGVQHAFLAIFVLFGLSWYVFGSIGWPRYAFAPLAVATLFIAKLWRDLLYGLAHTGGRARLGDHEDRRAWVPALLIVMALSVGFPLATQLRTLVSAHDQSPQLASAYLEANVPRSEVIETWEPELGLLTDHHYHYPPLGWLDRAVRARWLGSAPEPRYDPAAEAAPTYLVVGPFAKYTGIYAPTLAKISTGPIASFGQYDVYRMR